MISTKTIDRDRYDFRAALQRIAALEVGLWKTAQKIAREALQDEKAPKEQRK